MESLTTLVGWIFVAWGLFEVFIGVLYPRATSGPVAGGLCWLAQRAAAALWRYAPRHGRWLLSSVGPSLVVAQIAAWWLLLWLGFSLVAWPRLGETIIASGESPTPTDFFAAMYFAGYSLTTLGTGDLIPTSTPMRLMMVFQAAVGFSYFTLGLTYMMSVYTSLLARNHLAMAIECRTRFTGDPYVFLRSLLHASPDAVQRDEDALSQGMLQLIESHHFYPVLHYFRFPEPRYAMPRILFFCLEVSTVLRALQSHSRGEAETLGASGRLWHASNAMLDETMQHFIRRRGARRMPTAEQLHAFQAYLQEFAAARGDLPTPQDEWTSHYARLRERWMGNVQAIAQSQGIDDLIVARGTEDNGGDRP